MWIKIAIIGLAIRLIAIYYASSQQAADGDVGKKMFNQNYEVYLDSSLYQSPYMRHTYRSSPLLCWMVAPSHQIHPLLGKAVFALFDVVAIVFIYKIFESRSTKTKQANLKAANIISYLYSLNPIFIYVTANGNSEAVTMALASAFWYFYFGGDVHGNMSPIERADNLWTKRQPNKLKKYISYGLFGIWAHFSVYPILFIPLLIMHEYHSAKQDKLQHSLRFALQFGLVAGGVFLSLGAFFYSLYGIDFLRQTYFYHLVRRSSRHSKSVYFYEIYLNYLNDSSSPSSSRIINRILPSMLALLMISFVFVKKRSVFFCQGLLTCILVTFNQVVYDHSYTLFLLGMYFGIPEMEAFRQKKWSIVVTRTIKDLLIGPLPVLLWFLMALKLQNMVGEIKMIHLWFCSLFVLVIHSLLFSKFFLEMKPWSAQYQKKIRIEEAKRILSTRNKDD